MLSTDYVEKYVENINNKIVYDSLSDYVGFVADEKLKMNLNQNKF